MLTKLRTALRGSPSFKAKKRHLFGDNVKRFLVSIFALVGTGYHRVVSYMTTENLKGEREERERKKTTQKVLQQWFFFVQLG